MRKGSPQRLFSPVFLAFRLQVLGLKYVMKVKSLWAIIGPKLGGSLQHAAMPKESGLFALA